MAASPVNIGSRRELFVDRALVDRLDGATLRLHPPERREVVFQVEAPIENACTACYNLFQVDEEYRLEGPRGIAEIVRQLAGYDIPAAAWEKYILPAASTS